MGKKAFLVLLPVITLFSPIIFHAAPGWWTKITASLSSVYSPGASGPIVAVNSATPPSGNNSPSNGSGLLSGSDTPIHDLAHVLRFDVTPRWVVDRWPRVSTGLAQLQLQGYRVPLVTGTAEDDLAGALTYYFNPRQEVQRLTFNGTTGNANKLVHLLTTRYGFSRRLTNDPGVFLYETQDPGGESTSFLWIRAAGVVRSSEPLERFEVALVMERPQPG